MVGKVQKNNNDYRQNYLIYKSAPSGCRSTVGGANHITFRGGNMTDTILATKQLPCNDEKKAADQIDKKTNNYLNFSTVRGMIHRFLTYDRINNIEVVSLKYTKEELAQKLGITLKELKMLETPYCYRSIARKINLPLINLYCTTKWFTSLF